MIKSLVFIKSELLRTTYVQAFPDITGFHANLFFFSCFPQNSCKTCYTEKHSLAVELYTVLISIFSLGSRKDVTWIFIKSLIGNINYDFHSVLGLCSHISPVAPRGGEWG